MAIVAGGAWVVTSRESKRDRVPHMGWNSGGKIHDFTVVPGIRPLGSFGKGDLCLKSTLIGNFSEFLCLFSLGVDLCSSASALPGSLLEMQNLRAPHLRPPES